MNIQTVYSSQYWNKYNSCLKLFTLPEVKYPVIADISTLAPDLQLAW